MASVIPAKAGISGGKGAALLAEIPAVAGMTALGSESIHG